MKKWSLLAFLGATALLLWVQQEDPVTSARMKCERAIERFSGYDIKSGDVARAQVVGDINNGTVTMPFEIDGMPRNGMCIFENGLTKHISLDGKLLAGRGERY
jgi:hypothetical protein